jgi:hypothetical protein
LGYGVIGSPTDSGSVSLGSSPGTPAPTFRRRCCIVRNLRKQVQEVLAPSSSGPGRRPLKAVARVRIPSGLHRKVHVADVDLFCAPSSRSIYVPALSRLVAPGGWSWEIRRQNDLDPPKIATDGLFPGRRSRKIVGCGRADGEPRTRGELRVKPGALAPAMRPSATAARPLWTANGGLPLGGNGRRRRQALGSAISG